MYPGSRTDSRPQGFEKAKLLKRGIHECTYECGEYFDSKRKERKHMEHCAKRRDELAKYGSSDSESQSSVAKEKAEYRRFFKFLKSLKKMDPLKLLSV